MAKRNTYFPVEIKMSEKETKKVAADFKKMKASELSETMKALAEFGYYLKFQTYRGGHQCTAIEIECGSDKRHMLVSSRSGDPLLSMLATATKIFGCEEFDLRNAEGEENEELAFY